MLMHGLNISMNKYTAANFDCSKNKIYMIQQECYAGEVCTAGYPVSVTDASHLPESGYKSE